MINIKNKIISVHSTLGKDRAAKKRKRTSAYKKLPYKDRTLFRLKTLIVLIPVTVIIIIAVVLNIGFQQLSSLKTMDKNTNSESSYVISENDNNEKLLMIVSPKMPLSADYKPSLTEYNGIRADEIIINDLKSLMEEAKKQKLALQIKSGYISAAEQNELYEDEVRRLMAREGQSSAGAAEDAELNVPMGNHADTQLGLSISFSSNKTLDFTQSEEYLWLIKNSYKYGFVLRYPENKQRYTDIGFNPSLFRYVGKDNALKMQTLNMCLDEYIIYLHSR